MLQQEFNDEINAQDVANALISPNSIVSYEMQKDMSSLIHGINNHLRDIYYNLYKEKLHENYGLYHTLLMLSKNVNTDSNGTLVAYKENLDMNKMKSVVTQMQSMTKDSTIMSNPMAQELYANFGKFATMVAEGNSTEQISNFVAKTVQEIILQIPMQVRQQEPRINDAIDSLSSACIALGSNPNMNAETTQNMFDALNKTIRHMSDNNVILEKSKKTEEVKVSSLFFNLNLTNTGIKQNLAVITFIIGLGVIILLFWLCIAAWRIDQVTVWAGNFTANTIGSIRSTAASLGVSGWSLGVSGWSFLVWSGGQIMRPINYWILNKNSTNINARKGSSTDEWYNGEENEKSDQMGELMIDAIVFYQNEQKNDMTRAYTSKARASKISEYQKL